MEHREARKLMWISLFAVAFGFVEAAVVYYLRLLYDSDHVVFPLNTAVPSGVFLVECAREIATILILLGVAVAAGRNFHQRFAWFLYAFAVWDIFYYVWLKVLVNWPASLLTWDVLFLIPVAWAAPVLAPILVSATWILLALVIVFFPHARLRAAEWTLFILAGAIFNLSFVWDYSRLVLAKGIRNPELIEAIGKYIPTAYHWDLFIFAELLALSAIVLFYRRARDLRALH